MRHVTGATVVVAWVGNVDARTAPALAQELIDALTVDETGAVVVDLSAVTVMDSTGLGALVQVSNTAGELGKGITLRATPSPIRRLLERVGLNQVFDLDATGSAAPDRR